MAFSRVRSAQLSGLTAKEVMVETDISRGLYLFQIIGLADKAVEESRERVISALRNTTGKNPKTENQKVTVNLSPAELKKEGAYVDLAIAVGYLVATGEIPATATDNKLFVGELALDGKTQPLRGLLSIAQLAKQKGIAALYIPSGNYAEAQLVEGIDIFLVPTLTDLVSHLRGEEGAVTQVITERPSKKIATYSIDLGDVRGQAFAKRALTIAAAGGHNIILYGPPGTGKTMLAKAFHSILPPLSNDAFLDVATIYSSVGRIEDILSGAPPLRAPHHSASHVAIIGGGQTIRPGDITLAHHGILYMDEFPEFDRRVIEALREPIEEGHITVARAKGSERFPAQFILLAAMNPCPCGYRGSTIQLCRCNAAELARYQKKLSGPIIDRIDLWVPVSHIEYDALHERADKQESPLVRSRVAACRTLQHERFGKLNSALSSNEVQESSGLTDAAKEQLQSYAQRLKLSPRAYLRTIKVARTIADLDNSDTIDVPHILEALQYRPKFD